VPSEKISGLKKQSSCVLEVDAIMENVLNRKDCKKITNSDLLGTLDGTKNLVTSLSSIWIEESMRRRENGESSQCSNPVDVERKDVEQIRLPNTNIFERINETIKRERKELEILMGNFETTNESISNSNSPLSKLSPSNAPFHDMMKSSPRIVEKEKVDVIANSQVQDTEVEDILNWMQEDVVCSEDDNLENEISKNQSNKDIASEKDVEDILSSSQRPTIKPAPNSYFDIEDEIFFLLPQNDGQNSVLVEKKRKRSEGFPHFPTKKYGSLSLVQESNQDSKTEKKQEVEKKKEKKRNQKRN